MEETHCAKKQRRDNSHGGGDADAGSIYMIDDQSPSSTMLAGVMQMVTSMKDEMKKMRGKINIMENKLNGFEEENAGLKQILCGVEKETENRRSKVGTVDMTSREKNWIVLVMI